MQSFELTILGCSSATPTSKRNPTAQLLNIADRYFLIDCGEGTQIQLRRFKIKFQRINHIFISHLHGDHYLGLPGLISSMHLLGRTADLHVYCPADLKEIIDLQLKASQTYLKFNIVYHFHQYIDNELIFEDDKVRVKAISLSHRIPCCGFVFNEKEQPATISKEIIEKYRIPVEELQHIKLGADFLNARGNIIANEELIMPKPKPRSYAYCSDTIYDERLIHLVYEVNLLYHEATFLHEMEGRAAETFHTTAFQAATIAKEAKVKKLMIGHYSARYKNLQPLLDEAQGVFKNTVLAIEGDVTGV